MPKKFLLLLSCSLALLLWRATPAQAACWCENGAADGCKCSRTGTSAFPAQPYTYPYLLGTKTVNIYCDTVEETRSQFRTEMPLCGSSPEILPYCAYRLDPNGVIDQSQVTCYGVQFFESAGGVTNVTKLTTSDGHILPENKLNTIVNGPVVMDYGNGTTKTFGSSTMQVYWCNSGGFCCNRADLDPPGSTRSFQCAKPDIPDVDSFAYCSPQTAPPPAKPLPICAQPSGAGESRLFFPHLKGISFLSTLLQSMFNPAPSSLSNNALPASKDEPANISNPDVVTTKIQYHQGLDDDTQMVNQKDNNSSLKVNVPAPSPLYDYNGTPPYKESAFCSISDTRVNPGDDLLGPKIETTLHYTQKYTYEAFPSANCVADSGETDSPALCCSNKAAGVPATRDGYFDPPYNQNERYKCGTLPGNRYKTEGRIAVFTKSPLVDYIYSTLVTGPQSVLKRIFPKGNPTEFKEIPGEAKYVATAPGADRLKVGSNSDTPTIYIPHLGSLYDYFLQGLQKALRPLGFSATAPNNQNTCSPTLPTLPTVDPTCQTCSISFPSPSMKSIFESAASFYKVPVSVLVGVFYNEGGLNPSWSWDESKVLAASGPNCQVANCDSSNVSISGAKGPWQFLPGTWSSYSSAATEAGVSDGRTPNICNLLDSTFAAAKKIGQERGGAASYPIPECIGYVLNTGRGPSTSCYWSNPDIVTAARQYLGYCEDPQNPDPKYPPRLSCVANPSTCYQQSVLNIATCVVSP